MHDHEQLDCGRYGPSHESARNIGVSTLSLSSSPIPDSVRKKTSRRGFVGDGAGVWINSLRERGKKVWQERPGEDGAEWPHEPAPPARRLTRIARYLTERIIKISFSIDSGKVPSPQRQLSVPKHFLQDPFFQPTPPAVSTWRGFADRWGSEVVAAALRG